MLRLGTIPFNLFINDLNGGIESTYSGFTDNTKLAGVDYALSSCANIERDLNRLEEWADESLTKFNNRKFRILHLRMNSYAGFFMPLVEL